MQNAVLAWAMSHEDIRAIIVVGSRAREAGSVDALSDLDLILFVDNPDIYVDEHAWLEEFGEALVPLLNRPRGHKPEWLVLYAGGVKGDFMLVEANGDLATLLAEFPYQDVLARGYRVLLDRTGVESALLPRPTPMPSEPLTHQDLAQSTARFLLMADKIARCLARGELFRAHRLLGGELQDEILKLLEWQAHTGSGIDTWYGGRRLEQWADPQVLAELPDLFPAHESRDIAQALAAAIRLFRRLAEDIARVGAFPWPGDIQFDRVVIEIEAMLDRDQVSDSN
ncbi:MAG: aminoglycoside 6-adenylyltransferase [Caldilineales bacterium]|nr:aminoglycoside 6-adenylyltransferase [Caldilineales bacterium]